MTARPSISVILPPTKNEPYFASISGGSAHAAPTAKREATAAAAVRNRFANDVMAFLPILATMIQAIMTLFPTV